MLDRQSGNTTSSSTSSSNSSSTSSSSNSTSSSSTSNSSSSSTSSSTPSSVSSSSIPTIIPQNSPILPIVYSSSETSSIHTQENIPLISENIPLISENISLQESMPIKENIPLIPENVFIKENIPLIPENVFIKEQKNIPILENNIEKNKDSLEVLNNQKESPDINSMLDQYINRIELLDSIVEKKEGSLDLDNKTETQSNFSKKTKKNPFNKVFNKLKKKSNVDESEN